MFADEFAEPFAVDQVHGRGGLTSGLLRGLAEPTERHHHGALGSCGSRVTLQERDPLARNDGRGRVPTFDLDCDRGHYALEQQCAQICARLNLVRSQHELAEFWAEAFVPDADVLAIVGHVRSRAFTGILTNNGPLVHLMVDEPEKFVDPFLAAGADSLIAHHEVLADPRPFLKRLHDRGKKAGLAVKPETPVDVLAPLLLDLDLALCMTVHPGFSGQAFLPESPERIRQLKRLTDERNPKCELEVDGGIDGRTGLIAVKAGANVLVAASSIFHAAGGPAAGVRELMLRTGA